ncbi:hypothetical protein BN946_scf184766.g13 [Trametes cinnabarina]|uniref:Carboxypeptidase n=1 Tax=Pycnoporus cinnabarinus TaxID=5643 RepID=A0A060SBL7_PYCCI|nr:hypothetical protein BN946_scf184766.g13 [Trametes cinnabarina]
MAFAPLPVVALAVCAVAVVRAAYPPQDVPSSWPHDYPGKPHGDFSPAWQDYFEVKERLPNATWPISRNFAGNLPVNRAGHPNDTLFFWAFEKEPGSLTAHADKRSIEPWGIWLNGGPGSSSLIGLTSENGPIHINSDFSASQNNFSWDRLADYVWVDQPVGVGFSTADSAGYVHDEDEMGRDFMGFLFNLVKVFPSLKTRPLYLTGESYAGTYIPYIMKTYFGLADPPVKIAKFAIGDGTVGSAEVYELVPTVNTIETYPQLVGYDPATFEYFREQEHLCGYDLNLTYPGCGHFPTLKFIPGQGVAAQSMDSASRLNPATRARRQQKLRNVVQLAKRASQGKRRDEALVQKRDLSGRANGTIDPWYGCDIYDEMIDYAVNFSLPWSIKHDDIFGFDIYQVPDALDPEANMDASAFFNDPRTRAALHAPTSKNWQGTILYPFLGDPTSEGNDPMVIQNTTFGGIQGFTRRPSTPWFDDNGERGGIVHQERNWTYVLIEGAGHLVPYTNPLRGFILLRDFILGNNQTGLVTNSSGTVSVVGGESSSLAVDAIPGQLGIYVGSFSTQSTYTYPSATIAAWSNYIVTATATVITPATAITATTTATAISVPSTKAIDGSSSNNGTSHTNAAIHMDRKVNGLLSSLTVALLLFCITWL